MYKKYTRLRDVKGVTDYRVSKDTGIPRSVLSDWKAGRSVPKLNKIAVLAEYFDVPIEYFVTKEDE